MSFTQQDVMKALEFVIEPDLKKDIVSLGLVSGIVCEPSKVSFWVKVSNPAMHNKKRMQEACEHQIHRFLGNHVEVEAHIEALPKANERKPEHRNIMPGVKNFIAVSSGKGGVGKSTITSNLAIALSKLGYKVGIVDADIYGPSIPMMFDVEKEKPGIKEIDGKTWMIPVTSYGIKIMSIGFFANINEAVVWRGPMASKALSQLFTETEWGELDYMLIDLPPGTGDIHLTMVQSVPLNGAIIVSTPQAVALADAKKGVAMFQMPTLKVPVLGLVENMAWFTPAELPENKYYIFGKDGAKDLALLLNVPLLGQIPLVQSIREAGDVGRPAALQNDTPQANSFMQLAQTVHERVAQMAQVLV